MQQTYQIYQKSLYSRRYFIEKDNVDLVDMKFKLFSMTEAAGNFNGRDWQFKSNFLNNKILISSPQPKPAIEYVFNAPQPRLSGTIEIDHQTYKFKTSLVTKAWYEYQWLGQDGSLYMKFVLNGIRPKKDGKVIQEKELSPDKTVFLLALGLYLVSERY